MDHIRTGVGVAFLEGFPRVGEHGATRKTNLILKVNLEESGDDSLAIQYFLNVVHRPVKRTCFDRSLTEQVKVKHSIE